MTNYPNNNKKTANDTKVIEFAKEICEKIFATDAVNPLFLKNRTLTVSCNNSEIAQQVRENQEEIVKKINLKLGKNEVDRIRYLL
ncbi:MAG TPA: hypothetical protein DEB09_00285 [Candidatus Magasanikbacteria bacterium]|nr:hypothetical protein [Candidatus Magasanikbacteria bacterium]